MGIDKVIEKFGIYFDEVGLSKTYGRMFGVFMTSRDPISMVQLVDHLQISKSTASVELRRLLSMGVIEKLLLPDQRADYYQIKKDIWTLHLRQKIAEMKKLRAIIEEIPVDDRRGLKHLEAMGDYCVFIEEELEILLDKYIKNVRERNTGSYIVRGRGDQKFIVEWSKLSPLSDTYAEKMATLAELGIETFKDIEIDFIQAYPKAVEEDRNLAIFSGLEGQELESAMKAKLGRIFNTHPKEFSHEFRMAMANVYYYIVTIREEKSDRVEGFITFMGGGPIPKNELKIIILAVDKKVRRGGLASILIQSLSKIGVEYKKIFASTRPSNETAIRAFHSWGFREDQEAMKSSPAHFVKGHWVHLALIS